MSLATSVITFAGAPLPIGARISSRTTDSTINDVPMLSRQGSYAPTGLAVAQSVMVDIDLGGGDYSPSTGLPLLTMDDVNDELNRLYASLATGYHQLVIGETPARYLVCQKRKSVANYEAAYGRAHATMQIEFYAVDPRWLSVALNSQPLNTTAINQSFTNAGNLDAFPVFTFVGPSSQAISLRCGAYGITTNATLGATDTLVIDCDPRTWSPNRILLNGVSRYDLIASITNTSGDDYIFPRMLPGANIVSCGGAAANASTIAWRDAYAL